MKVILLKNVQKIGRKHEVKDVSDGHALNFLIPQGLAEVATQGALKRLETEKKREDEKRKIHEDLLLKNISDLEGTQIEIEEKANEQGHLFAGIHADELAPLIHNQTRLEILPDHILLEKPIKTTGEHTITVKVQDATAHFKLIVNPKI